MEAGLAALCAALVIALAVVGACYGLSRAAARRAALREPTVVVAEDVSYGDHAGGADVPVGAIIVRSANSVPSTLAAQKPAAPMPGDNASEEEDRRAHTALPVE